MHMGAAPAHAVQRISCLSQRAVRNDTEHATRDARHETDAGAASSIPLSRPDMRQTLQDPPNLPYPTRRCEERECAPRSSTCTLLVVVESAGPVAGVIRGIVRLRSAVEEVAGGVLHDTHRLAAGHRHCSATASQRSGRAARTSAEPTTAWRRLASTAIFARVQL